jgi:hypothetical protein
VARATINAITAKVIEVRNVNIERALLNRNGAIAGHQCRHAGLSLRLSPSTRVFASSLIKA